MLHQNNNDQDTYIYYGTSLSSKLKRNKSMIYIIIACIVFAIICISVTAFLIWQRNNTNADYAKKQSIEKTKQAMEKMKVGGLADRYKENDIDIIYYLEHIGQTRNNILEQDEKTTKLTIKNMAIKGLKDKNIENKINSKISEEMVKLYTNEEINNPNVDYVNITGYVVGNYSNTISIYIIKSKQIVGEPTEEKRGKSINVDLNTGEEITFEDLFLPGASVKNVLSQVVYDNLTSQYIKNGIVINNSIDLTGIEDEVYAILRKYHKGVIKEFYYNSNTICFAIGNDWYSFPMWKYYEKIGIYNRYNISGNIYDGTHKKTQENFIFQEQRDELVNQKISDNFIAIIVTPYNLRSRSEAFINKFNEYFDNAKVKVQELKKEAENNKEQTIILASKIIIDNLNNYWSFTPEGQPEKKTDLLKEFEICEVGQNDSVIRISNKDYKDKLILEMYKRNYGIDKFANMTVEELFSLVGNRAKIEFANIEKSIVDIKSNKSIEDTIDEQFKKKTDEIDRMIKDTSKEQDITQIEAKLSELRTNLEILQGKFANSENEKIKAIENRCIQSIATFEQDIYNLKLKREIQVVFDNQIKELNTKKQDNNIELVEEKAYYLSQVLNSYQTKNINNNWEINTMITNYSKEIVSLQDWALKTRQKKIEEEKKKQEEERRRQNQMNNTINNTITNNTNTTNNTTTNSITNDNTTNNINTTNTTYNTTKDYNLVFTNISI